MAKPKDATDETTNSDPVSPTLQPAGDPPPGTSAAPQSTPPASAPATGEATTDEAAAEKKLAGELGEGPVDVVYDNPDGPPQIGIAIAGYTIYFEKGVTQPLSTSLAVKLLLSGRGFSRAAAPAPQQQ